MIEKTAQFCKNMTDWFKSERCFVKYFIDAFRMTNGNILLLTILLLFVFLMSIYILIVQSGIITLITLILIMSILASGLFYSMKESIKICYAKDENNGISNLTVKNRVTLGMFCTGVGKYYLSFLGMLILFFIMSGLVIYLTFIAASHFICDISKLGIDIRLFFLTLADPNSAGTILSGLDKTEQMYFRDWNRLFLITTQLYTFLLIFWIPETLFVKKNIFISLFNSVIKVIKNLPNALCIYLTILLINYIIAGLTILSNNNALLIFILSILSFYLVIYDFYAIFLYYKSRYIDIYDRG